MRTAWLCDFFDTILVAFRRFSTICAKKNAPTNGGIFWCLRVQLKGHFHTARKRLNAQNPDRPTIGNRIVSQKNAKRNHSLFKNNEKRQREKLRLKLLVRIVQSVNHSGGVDVRPMQIARHDEDRILITAMLATCNRVTQGNPFVGRSRKRPKLNKYLNQSDCGKVARLNQKEKTMAKTTYTPLFEQFWKAYPRRVGKMAAFKSWQSHVDEDDAFMPKAVIDDIEKRNRLRFWHADKSKIPMPSTFLNQHRWEDEDWEDEIKTRGKENMATYKPMPMPKERDDGPLLSHWELMCNRMMRSYLLLAGGFSDEQLVIFKRVKKTVLGQMLPVIKEEIDADNSPEKRTEMAWMLGRALMNHLDIDLKMNFGHRVINMGKVAT